MVESKLQHRPAGAPRSTTRATDEGRGGFGLYVHYPLCRTRCGYCDFPIVTQADFPHRAYADQVLCELEARAADYRALALNSIYFGGGTPSLWPVGEVARIVDRAVALFSGLPKLEVTLEANPGTLTCDTIRSLARSGVNRLSVGVQALDDGVLRQLTRDHSAAEAAAAVAAARDAGIENIACDLIFGIAGQTAADHALQLKRLLSLEPTHISLYQLTLSRGSALYRDGLRPVDDDTSAEMLESGRDLLGQHGLLQYEVSNYARPPHHSHHNLSCWRGNPYLGIGAAAHSLLVDGDCNWRMINPPFSRYLGASASESHPRRMVGTRTFRSDRTTAQFEWMLLGLRTVEGVDRQAFSRRFACDPGARYAAPLSRLRNMDLIEINRTHIRPTARGIWFADELAHRLDG